MYNFAYIGVIIVVQ